MIIIEKLDGRHSGRSLWSHRAWIRGADKAYDFHQIRTECWSTFGPACSRDDVWPIRKVDPMFSPDWCWHHDWRNNAYYLYFKGTHPMASWILLKS